MNFKQLLLRNFIGDFRSYAGYFISSTFAVWIFYIFSLLLFHSKLDDGQLGSSVIVSNFAKGLLGISLVVISIISLLFLWYTFSVFIKRRKHDLAIYLTLGIDNRDLRRMLFVENSLLGFFSTICGILLGIISSKFILLIIQNLMHLQNILPFQVPIFAVLLTIGVFFMVFIIISMFNVQSLQNEKLISLIKENDRPKSVPKAHWAIVLLAMLTLFIGYGSILYFAAIAMNFPFILLLVGVLLTIIATFLLFQQFSVFILTKLKKRSFFLKGSRLLTISEWIYRMRDNANMYSLIAISTSIAFVGIGILLAITDDARELSVAYLFSSNTPYVETQVEEVKQLLESEGYHPIVHAVKPIYATPIDVVKFITSDGYTMTRYGLTIIRESDYRALMKQAKQTPDQIENNQILVLSEQYSESKALAKKKIEERTLEVPLAIDGNQTDIKNVKIILSPNLLSMDFVGISVVTDATFEQWYSPRDTIFSDGFLWLDYEEWADDLQLTEKINKKLDHTIEKNQQLADETFEKLGDQVMNMSEEEVYEANPYSNRFFHYSSKASLFQEKRETNGFILTIIILVGAVFFVFSAAIIYFRLFSDIDRDSKYHRSLTMIGVTQKDRHQVIKHQLQGMFLLPTITAAIHFAVAMTALHMVALQMQTELPTLSTYFKVVCVYLIVQLIYYRICLYRYQKKIDYLVERITD